MLNKIKALQEKYKTEGEAFLFTNQKETFYLSGAEFDGFWIFACRQTIYVVCSKMTQNQMKEFFAGQNAEIIAGAPFSAQTAKAAKDNAVKRIITDAKYISAADFIVLQKKLAANNIELCAKTGVLDNLRIVKTSEEIANLRKACEIVSQVCQTVKEEIKAGMTELDVCYRVLELFAQNKVKESFTPIVAAGENSANPHHASSNRKIRENDIIMMDIGCVYKGYCSDLTRTYFLGKINTKFREIWDIVKESQSAVLKAIKAGLPVSWADKTARNVIDAAGYKDNFIHTTGHGVGIEIHEMPLLAYNAEGVFLSSTAVTVEPGIYLAGEFGVRIEDTILITENGCEILTSAPYK
ncbi:M24 family metallopeptidase [Endomicrobium proavitum]|uniref:Aminoacylproline aminopeptidase n=1 Tax=Endomicrobium proavitum TaxID=1408281 RepID=A0A0G3WIR8_9BACT|nr:Xaa-Pro peptidase family protein [Endomicrobium proavitum]AKL98536.1 Aminoacylproline aminopeptidase [Endomicrobium proavitum]